MILSSRTQFSGDRTRLRTERPVRAVNTAYGRVFTIIRQRPSQKPSDRRTGHMAYLCPNFAEPVHPTHHGQPTPRACHCNNTEQRAITMRSVLVVQAELFTIIRPLLAKYSTFNYSTSTVLYEYCTRTNTMLTSTRFQDLEEQKRTKYKINGTTGTNTNRMLLRVPATFPPNNDDNKFKYPTWTQT